MNVTLIPFFGFLSTRIAKATRQFLGLGVLSALLSTAVPVLPASARTVELWNRPGGYTFQHIAQANRWLASGTRLVIRDWQVSAAAIQVVYFKRRAAMCVTPSRASTPTRALFPHERIARSYRNNLAQYIVRRMPASRQAQRLCDEARAPESVRHPRLRRQGEGRREDHQVPGAHALVSLDQRPDGRDGGTPVSHSRRPAKAKARRCRSAAAGLSLGERLLRSGRCRRRSWSRRAAGWR